MEDFKVEVKKNIDDVKRVGIVRAKDWFFIFGTFYGTDKVPKELVHPDDFVLCQWSDFHDGVNSHIEGKETLAICRRIEDAYALFKLR